MSNPETPTRVYDDFEQLYGRSVADLVVQSRIGCHNRSWVESAASQLTDLVTYDSGLERDEVRTRLNAIWPKVLEVGPAVYIQNLPEMTAE